LAKLNRKHTVGGKTAKQKASGTFTGTKVDVLNNRLMGSFNYG